MVHLKPFEQRADFCGPSVLKMVLHYYGIEKTEKYLAKIMKVTRAKGVEAEDLLRAAKKFKLKGKIKDNSDLNDIRKYVQEKKIPVIVEWFLEDEGHFSVVTDIDKENIYLQDPSLGHLRAMIRKKFLRIWFTFPGAYIKHEYDIILRRMLVLWK